MSLMLKLSTLTVATTLLLSANKFNLEDYVKKDLIKNPQVKVNSVKLLDKVDIENKPNWKAYLFVMDLGVKGKESTKYPETIYVNEKDGVVVVESAPGLYDYVNHKKIGENIKPKLTDDYYQDSHLIAGNKNAKHKLVVFTDPQCPFCIKIVPDVYKTVKENPDTFALYYYHMPLLRLHPVSEPLVRAMESLQKKGRNDDAMKMYNLKIKASEKNETKILAEIKKQLNIDISKEDMNKKEIKEQVKEDMDMATNIMLRGTPTIYLDGKFQKDRKAYKKLIKK